MYSSVAPGHRKSTSNPHHSLISRDVSDRLLGFVQAVLLHFDMFHRGTKRLEHDAGHPHRPMIKFQFFRTSEPLEPSWHCPDGLLDAEPFAFTGQPDYKQAIWESTYKWMAGVADSDTVVLEEEDNDNEVAELAAAMRDTAIGSEQQRIGSGYTLGQRAGAGSAEALQALLAGIDSLEQSERRAAMWGLSVAGSAAVGALLERVALTPVDSHENFEKLADLILALGEAAVAPVSPIVAVIGKVMEQIHRGIDVSSETDLAETRSEWRLSTAFCGAKFKKLYARKEWEALAATAQSLMCVAQTAAAAGDVAGCVDILALGKTYVAVDINLGPTTRRKYSPAPAPQLHVRDDSGSERLRVFIDNACMSMLALTPPGLLPEDSAVELEAMFATSSEDDDRCVNPSNLSASRSLSFFI